MFCSVILLLLYFVLLDRFKPQGVYVSVVVVVVLFLLPLMCSNISKTSKSVFNIVFKHFVFKLSTCGKR